MSSEPAQKIVKHPRTELNKDEMAAQRQNAVKLVQDSLKSTTLETVLKEKKEKLHSRPILLEHNMTVGDALKTLARHHILSAPMVIFPTLQGDTDEIGGAGVFAADDSISRPTYLGIIDIYDIALALLAEVPESSKERTIEEWAKELRKIEEAFMHRMLITVIGHGDGELLFNAKLGTSLLDTIKAGFLSGAASRPRAGSIKPHVNHRIAIFDDHGSVVEIVSQSDILRYFNDHPDILGSLGGLSVEELGMCPGSAADVPHLQETVAESVPTIQALAIMRDKAVSALGVVDEHGALCANLSVADLRGIVPPHLDVLSLPVGDFLRQTHGAGGLKGRTHIFFDDEEATKRRHKRRRTEPTTATGAGEGELPLVVCTRSTPLGTAIMRIVTNNVHRIYVVDQEDKKPVSVITPTDILRIVAS